MPRPKPAPTGTSMPPNAMRTADLEDFAKSSGSIRMPASSANVRVTTSRIRVISDQPPVVKAWHAPNYLLPSKDILERMIL